MRRFVVVVAVLLSCGRPQAAVSAGPGADTSIRGEVEQPIDALAGALAAARTACVDVRCFDGLAEWAPVRQQERGRLDPAELHAELQRFVDTQADPTRRGIALLWLTAWKDPADTSRFEAALDDQRVAWEHALSRPTQATRLGAPPVDEWVPRSLSDLGLAGLEAVAGRKFEDVAGYATWRSKHRQIEDSPAYWAARIPTHESKAMCAAQTAAAAEHDARLPLAVAAIRQSTCPTVSDVRASIERDARFGNVLDAIESPASWVEPDQWPAAVRWVFEHAEELLGSAEAARVAGLARSGPVSENNNLAGLAVVAAARLDPASATPRLREAARTLADPPPAFYRTYSAQLSGDPQVLQWAQPPPKRWACHHDKKLQAVVQGLVDAGRPGRPVLATIIREHRSSLTDDARFADAIAMGAAGLGAAQVRRQCRPVREQCLPRKKTRKSVRDALDVAASEALPGCAAALLRWADAR